MLDWFIVERGAAGFRSLVLADVDNLSESGLSVFR